MSSAAGSSLDRRILKLALPNIVSNLTVPLLGLVDMGLTGHLEDAAPIAGISIATTLFNLIYWVFSHPDLIRYTSDFLPTDHLEYKPVEGPSYSRSLTHSTLSFL